MHNVLFTAGENGLKNKREFDSNATKHENMSRQNSKPLYSKTLNLMTAGNVMENLCNQKKKKIYV